MEPQWAYVAEGIAGGLGFLGAGSEEITTFLNNNFPFQDPVDQGSPPTE